MESPSPHLGSGCDRSSFNPEGPCSPLAILVPHATERVATAKAEILDCNHCLPHPEAVLAQLIEHETPNLRVVGSNSMLGTR